MAEKKAESKTQETKKPTESVKSNEQAKTKEAVVPEMSEEDKMAQEAAMAALDDYDTDMESAIGEVSADSVSSVAQSVKEAAGNTGAEEESLSDQSTFHRIVDGMSRGEGKATAMDFVDTGLAAAGTYLVAKKLTGDNKWLSLGAAGVASLMGLTGSGIIRGVNDFVFDKNNDAHEMLDGLADKLDPEGSDAAKAMQQSAENMAVQQGIVQMAREEPLTEGMIPKQVTQSTQSTQATQKAEKSSQDAPVSRRDVEILIQGADISPEMELGS